MANVGSSRYDYGAILFLDERFLEPRTSAGLSRWLRACYPPQTSSTSNVLSSLTHFFDRWGLNPPGPQAALHARASGDERKPPILLKTESEMVETSTVVDKPMCLNATLTTSLGAQSGSSNAALHEDDQGSIDAARGLSEIPWITKRSRGLPWSDRARICRPDSATSSMTQTRDSDGLDDVPALERVAEMNVVAPPAQCQLLMESNGAHSDSAPALSNVSDNLSGCNTDSRMSVDHDRKETVVDAAARALSQPSCSCCVRPRVDVWCHQCHSYLCSTYLSSTVSSEAQIALAALIPLFECREQQAASTVRTFSEISFTPAPRWQHCLGDEGNDLPQGAQAAVFFKPAGLALMPMMCPVSQMLLIDCIHLVQSRVCPVSAASRQPSSS